MSENEFTDIKIDEEHCESDNESSENTDDEDSDHSEDDYELKYIDISEEGKIEIKNFIKNYILEVHNDLNPKRQ